MFKGVKKNYLNNLLFSYNIYDVFIDNVILTPKLNLILLK